MSTALIHCLTLTYRNSMIKLYMKRNGEIMNQKKQLLVNTIIIAIGKLSTQVISFLLLPLYTSKLTPGEYGTYDLLVTISTFLLPIITLLMEESMFRFLIDADDLKEKILTSVESFPTTIFAFCRPINAMKRPIPTDTACFRFIGMELKIASRTFVRERRMKMIPSANTADNACCQVYPIPRTTV